MTSFGESGISDAKRAVRRLQFDAARGILGETGRRPVRVFILAGPSPAEEIGVARSTWRATHVIAADKERSRVEMADEAGADEVFVTRDATRWARGEKAPWGFAEYAAADRRIDVVSLDLQGQVKKGTGRMLSALAESIVAPGGVVIFTFSYGREKHQGELEREFSGGLPRPSDASLAYFSAFEVPVYRVAMLGRRLRGLRIEAVRIYMSGSPMCSVLMSRGPDDPAAWPRDISAPTGEIIRKTSIITDAELARLVDAEFARGTASAKVAARLGLPRERLEAFMRERRRAAAGKAVATREARAVKDDTRASLLSEVRAAVAQASREVLSSVRDEMRAVAVEVARAEMATLSEVDIPAVLDFSAEEFSMLKDIAARMDTNILDALRRVVRDAVGLSKH